MLGYGEDLDAGSEPAVGDFAVSVVDWVTSVVSTPAVSAVSISGVEVTLTLAVAVRYGDAVALDYTPGADPIQDGPGNDAAALDGQAVVNNTLAATVAMLSTLELLHGSVALSLSPGFAAGTADYTASVLYEVAAVTVNATATDARAAVVLPDDADAGTAGVQVDLVVGVTEITVTVTPEDGESTVTYTIEVTRAPDTAAPQLGSAAVDGASLVLTYGEDLDAGSEPAAGDFVVSVTDSVTSAMSAPTVSSVSVDGDEVTLTLAVAVRHGDVVLLDYTAGTNPIQDLSDNDAAGLDDQAVLNNTAAATDATLSALGLLAGADAVALSPGFAANEASYAASVLYEVAVVTVNATSADSRAAVVLPDDADTVTGGVQVDLVVGANTITVTVTAEDGSTTGTYAVVVTRADETDPPVLDTAVVDGASLVLTYDEALDTNSQPAVADFVVSVTDSVTSAVSTPVVSSVSVDGAAVTLLLAAARYGDVVLLDYTAGTNPIQDLFDNDAAGLDDQAVTNNTAVATDATLSALGLSAGADAVALSPGFAANEASYAASVAYAVTAVTVNATAADERAAVVLPDDDDTVTAGVQVNLVVGANTITVVVTAEDGSTTGTYTIEVTRADETDPPVLSSAVVDGLSLVLAYSEDLDTGSEPATGDFAVSVVDSVTSVVSAPAVSSVSISGDEVTLVLPVGVVRYGDTVTLDYTPGADPIQDGPGNDAAALDGQAVTNDTAAATVATLSVLELLAGETAVVLSPGFAANEASYSASVAYEAAAVTVNATAGDERAALVLPDDADTGTGGVQVNLVVGANTITVTVTAEDGSTTSTYTIEVTRAADTAVPVLDTAVVDGSSLVLTYGEDLDEDSQPAVGDFVVSVTDSATPTVSTPVVSSVLVDGAEVTLVLAAAVRHRDVVLLDYTPGASPVQDLSDNDAAGLDDQAVLNNTAAATDATLSALGLLAGADVVVLSPGFAAGEASYTASVAAGVGSVTVTAAATDSRAAVVLPGDADAGTAGVQVDLGVGATAILVTVTAEDGSTTGAYTVTIAHEESSAPTLSSVVVDGSSLVLAYDEDLDVGSEPAVGDFVVSVVDSVTSAGSAPAVSSVSVDADEVTLTLAVAVRHGDAVTLDYTAGTSPIQDISQNDAAGLDDQVVTNNTAAALDATLSALGLSNGEVAVALSPAFGEGAVDYEASVGYEVAAVTVNATAADSRAAVVLPDDVDAGTAGVQVNLVVGETTTVTVTVTAEDGSTTVTYTIEVTRAEDTAPQLRIAVVDGASLVLAYDEDLDAGSAPAVGDFAVSVVDSVTSAVSAPAVSSVSVDGAAVALTLAAAVSFGDTVTLDYTPGSDAIQDAAGLEAAALDDQAVFNITGLTLGLRRLELSGIELSPAFSQSVTIYTASVDYPSSSTTVTAIPADPQASVVVTPGDTDSDASNGHQAPLTVGSNTITVTVAESDGETATVYTITVTRGDETGGPTLSSATVNAASLVLGYSEDLDEGSEPVGSDFVVSVTDSATSATSTTGVSLVSISGDEVTLTLAEAVRLGDTVTLDYTPGSDPIQDEAGDDAYSLRGHSVTNTTVAATDAALSVLGLSTREPVDESESGNSNGDGGPVVPDGGPVVPDGGPVVPDGGPVVPDGGPVVPDGGPVVPDGGPVVPDGGPVVPDGGPVVPDGGPVVPDGGPVVPDGGVGGETGGGDVLLNIELSPVFAEGTTVYSATVDYSVSSLTVVARSRDLRASVEVASSAADDGVGDGYLSGYRASLVVGSNTITVTVTAEDGETTAVYTVTVTRLDETDPPELRSAVVDDASVVLSYSEVLDDMSNPAVSDFSVSVTDSVTSVASTVAVRAVSVSVSEIFLDADDGGEVQRHGEPDLHAGHQHDPGPRRQRRRGPQRSQTGQHDRRRSRCGPVDAGVVRCGVVAGVRAGCGGVLSISGP